jgi:DNA-binding NarL/FixJ family response regulator
MIRILIADDHAIFRDGLRRVLAEHSGFAVVGEATGSRDAISQARELSADLVLLDIRMPGRGALETVEELCRLGCKVLVLTAQPEDHYAVRLLRAGASGYLTKEQGAKQLIEAIEKIAAGGRYIGPKLAETIAWSVAPQEGQAHEALSGRELQVLVALASGRSVQQIADELALSPKTVSTYRSRVLEKLHLTTNSDLVRYALQAGLVE